MSLCPFYWAMGYLIWVFLAPPRKLKKEMKKTSRYKRIVKNLKSEQTLPYLSSASFVGQEFEKFLIPFESSEP